MWRAFQTAAFVNVGETFSVTRPIDVRCALMRLTTSEARSGRDVPQSEPGVQSPTTAAAFGGDVAATTDATRTRRKTAAAKTPRGEWRTCIRVTPWVVGGVEAGAG
jgi:hypothetical protein